MPKFTIIVPVYNTEKYLEGCINSILLQTIEDFELLLINDGSSDKSGEICDRYALKDNRISVFHKENGGSSSARNIGLDNAKGDYICFVDSDDTIGKHYLEILMPKDDEDFVQCGVSILENDYLKCRMSHEDIFADYNKFWMGSRQQWIAKCCYSKAIIDKFNLRFDTDLTMGEDGLFNHIFLSKCNMIRRTEENEYYYNQDNLESVSHKYYPDRLEQQVHLLHKLEEVLAADEMYRIRWDYWHEVLNHYKKKGLKAEENRRKHAQKKIKETYKEDAFRRCVKDIRSKGSLDEKVESYLMNYYVYFLYKPLVRVMGIISRLKSLCKR